MSKTKSHSTWSGLTVEQREKLDSWLFEENAGYREVVERAQKEWGIAGSISSVGRYYRDRELELSLGEMAEVEETAEEMDGTAAKVDKLRTSAWKVIGARLLDKALRRGETEELAALGRLMSMSEEREIQRGRLELARERFEFRAAKAALEQMRKLEEMNLEDLEREEARVHEIKVRLFGKRYPRLPDCSEAKGPMTNDQDPND